MCESGIGSKLNNDNSVAQQLSNKLNIPVVGYTGKYGYSPFFPINNAPIKDSKRVIFYPKGLRWIIKFLK